MIKYDDIPKLTTGNYQPYFELREIKYTIDRWKKRESGLILEPDFQRYHVWNKSQQIKFIEYLLKGGTSGRILYFNHPGWQSNYKGEFVLVDGLQRLTATLLFLNNKLPVFGNNFYRDFDRIDFEIGLYFNVNNLKTKKEVVQWYIDLNEGGVVHTPEEIEKAKNILKKLKNGD